LSRSSTKRHLIFDGLISWVGKISISHTSDPSQRCFFISPMPREGLGKGGKCLPSLSSAAFRPSHLASSAPALRRTGGESPVSSDDEGGGSSSIGSRCSPKAVYSVISKFSEYKKQVVRDIGFGGILDLPCITKVNLRLSSWLLSKLDMNESALVLPGSKRI
jgi:hypothetical protein